MTQQVEQFVAQQIAKAQQKIVDDREREIARWQKVIEDIADCDAARQLRTIAAIAAMADNED